MGNLALLLRNLFTVALILPGLVATSVYGLAESTGPEGSNARALYNLDKTGDGIEVGILGLHYVEPNHTAFENIAIENITQEGFDNVTIEYWHDTIMAGIIASGGWEGHEDQLGLAPGIDKIYCFKLVTADAVAEGLGWLVDTNGCRVVATGFDLGTFDDYTINRSKAIYDYYAYKYNAILVCGAGKYQPNINPPVTQVSCPGSAYNVITTAGLILNDSNNEDVYRRIGTESLSGPTKDDRRKPDICAPSDAQTVPWWSDPNGTTNTNGIGGDSGATSWAIPHTAGAVALLLSLAESTIEDPCDSQNEVIKAVIVNSACPNINDKVNSPTTREVFDYDRGYGRLDAMRAYQTLSSPRLREGSSTTDLMGWGFEHISENNSHTFTVFADANDRLAVTLTWNRFVKKIGQNYVPEDSCINLDLEVCDAFTDQPVFIQIDPNNNLEKCDIVIPQTGYYDIKIINRDSNKSRSYGMAFEVIEPIVGDFNLDYSVDYNDLDSMLIKWLDDATGLDIDMFTDGTINLRDISILAENWLNYDKSYYEY